MKWFVAKKQFESFHKLMNTILQKVKQGASDVEGVVEKFVNNQATAADKAKEAEEKKRCQLELRQQKANEKKRKAEAKKQAKVNLQKQPLPVALAYVIPSLPSIMAKAATFTKMVTFNDDADFTAKIGSHTKSVPYVILSSEKLKALTTENSVKLPMGVYRVQLPHLESVKLTMRGQMPSTCDRRARLFEVLRSFVPDDMSSKCIGLAKPLQDQVSCLSIFGAVRTMVYVGIERNGIGNIRINFQGKRQVLLVSFEGIKKLAAALGEEANVKPNEDVPGWIKRVLEHAGEGHVDTLKGCSWFHEQGPDQVMVIPMGYACIERAVDAPNPDGKKTEEEINKETQIVGPRVHYLEGKDANGFKHLEAMNTLQVQQAVKPADKTSPFWTAVLNEVQKH